MTTATAVRFEKGPIPSSYKLSDGNGVMGWIQRDMWGDGWWCYIRPLEDAMGSAMGMTEQATRWASSKADAAETLRAWLAGGAS